ncbi:C40 family peptidase [Kocuria palustris]|uniref:C40 family peptidase n=1 Tax=Kocuria palustris TaxID=71999 RepID=UPI001EF8DA6F|nr:C40 family peptidase [Kocuria palustris]MBM7823545.1 cell wall-associated NlpC family hydrolase [Kocuria palustris]
MNAVALRSADPVRETWAFDARDLAGLRSAPALRPLAGQIEPMLSARAMHPSGGAASRVLSGGRTVRAPAPLAGAAGLGLVGAALLGAAPAQAAAIEFPAWVTVTGTVPDDAGLDRAAAEANDWTLSWSTDADGVVSFAYADGSRSTSLDPTARHAAPPTAADTAGGDQLGVHQSLQDTLWESDPAQPAADPGLDDLASAATAPFERSPGAETLSAGPQAALAAPAAPAHAPTTEQATTSAADTGGGVSDEEILATARLGLGGQYVWGGTDFKAWDCSAFVQWVYAQHGLELPRVTWEQFAAAEPTADPRPGDLVSQNGGSHVGIYLGGDRMISALNPQQGTIEHSVHDMALDGFYTVR